MSDKGIIREWIIPIGSAVIIALLINKFLFFQVRIPSESMYPTIKIGDIITATRVYDKRSLKRGDIVVFYSKELKLTLIKRLIGLPGDEVVIEKSGQVLINGEKLEESYVVYKDNLTGKFKVPEGKYFFLGDNRPVSGDSRKWKDPYVEGREIQGKARFIVFPFNRFGKFVIGKEALKH